MNKLIENIDFSAYKDPGILEFKDVVIEKKTLPLTMVACPGKVSSIVVDPTAGHQLIMTILGLDKIQEGYITIDGELITYGSGAFFRQMMCYVPHFLPQVDMTIGELCRQVISKFNGKNLRAEALTDIWKSLSIDASIWKEKICKVSQTTLWLVLLSLVPLSKGSIVLIEEPLVKNEAVDYFVSQLAQQGKEVICTTQTHPFTSYQVMNLTL